MREIISIHIGQAGVQAGNACWELLCLEHGIQNDQQLYKSDIDFNDNFTAFFAEIKENKYVPKSLFIDLEPTAINEIKQGVNKDLFLPEQFISGKEDAASNYARGYYKVGSTILEESLNKIRKIAENCAGLQGFVIFNSVGGGTGSGFGSLLLEKLSNEYNKKTKIGLTIFPSPKLSPVIVEPYNSVLQTHKLREYVDLVVVLDNEAIYNICNHQLDIEIPNYTNLNRLAAQAFSAMTLSIRYDGSLNTNLLEFQENLVPYPGLHFILTSCAPFLSAKRVYHEDPSTYDITDSAFDSSHMLAKCDPTKGKYITCNFMYSGDIIPREANAAIIVAREKRKVPFIDWLPVGVRCGINYNTPMVFPGGDTTKVVRSLFNISNHSAIVQVFSRINKDFDLMYEKNAFLHWYYREGMEDEELYEARYDMTALENEYKELEQDPNGEEGEIENSDE